MLEIIQETFSDTWMMLPLLYITYCILEVFERRPQNDDRMFYSLQKYGPLFGAAFGLLPQCGFSIIAAMLYLQNMVTLGTVVAVMIATSDEAIPILLANPAMYLSLGKLLVLKLVIAVAVGFFTDKVLFRNQKILRFEDLEEEAEESDENGEESSEEEGGANSCPCCYTQYPLYISAALRSLKIYAFILITTFVLGLLMKFIGPERLGSLLLKDSIFQPAIAALLGFIPNCAITVVLAELFAGGQLQFGSLLAGLITNAGLGLLCLIQYGAERKSLVRIISILYVSALLFGILFLFI